MWREVDKRDLQAAEDFIKRHGVRVPRTILRYGLERFSEAARPQYLRGTMRGKVER